MYWDATAEDGCLDGWESSKGENFFLNLKPNFDSGENGQTSRFTHLFRTQSIANIHTSSGIFLAVEFLLIWTTDGSVPWSSQQSTWFIATETQGDDEFC
jgi:hypothetical protein